MGGICNCCDSFGLGGAAARGAGARASTFAPVAEGTVVFRASTGEVTAQGGSTEEASAGRPPARP
eukprot:2630445-Pleurochrysis_carterae.AAC.1